MAVRKEIAICKIVFQVFAFIIFIFIFNVKCYCSLSSNDSAKIRQFPDTAKFQRVIRRDFQHAFNPKTVKQSNSPFCAPQLILFQKRKHRVKEKKTQHLIQYSVIQFFFKGLLFTPLKSKVYILSIYLYINIYNII